MFHVNKLLYPGNEGKNVYQFQDKKVACFAFRVLVIITVTFDVALWYYSSCWTVKSRGIVMTLNSWFQMVFVFVRTWLREHLLVKSLMRIVFQDLFVIFQGILLTVGGLNGGKSLLDMIYRISGELHIRGTILAL